MFVATTLPVTLALQNCVTACPLLEIAAEPAVTFTSAWKPPGHWFIRVYVAVQAFVPGVGLSDGLTEGDGLTDGDGDGDGEPVGGGDCMP